jgi:sugar lactone lactonase YvrE
MRKIVLSNSLNNIMRKIFTFPLFIAFLLLISIARAQNVSTVAGGGSHNGVPALSVPMTNPNAMAIDAAGNLYVANNSGANIRKIDLSGTVTTVAGGTPGPEVVDGQPAVSGELQNPSGVAVDAAGNIYFTELNNKVRMVSFATGLVSTYAGTGVAGYSGDGGAAISAQFSQPRGLAIDALGNLYIADRANGVIRKIDFSGNISTVAGTGVNGYSGEGTAINAKLNLPYGIALDGTGNHLYIADDSNHRVRMVDLTSGMISTVAGDGIFQAGNENVPATATEFKSITGVFVDGANNIYITDSKAALVRKVDAATGLVNTIVGVLGGTPGFAGDGGAATGAKLAAPISSILDGSGNLFIADQGNQRVRKVSSSNISTYAGTGVNVDNGDGGLATNAILSGLPGVATDVDGNIFFSDFQAVREVDVNLHLITTVAGTGVSGTTGDGSPAAFARLCNPSGVYVDGTGNLYICSSCESKIRKVNTSGIITTFAGTGTPGYSGDLGLATSANLDNVTAITGDAAGNIYINDPVHGVVRKIDLSGNITTVAGNGIPGYSGDGAAATLAQLSSVNGLAVDAAGNLYISDNTPNNVVRKVAVGTGIISTVAGGGAGTGNTGDGGLATAALFGNITNVYSDITGNLYITDKGFNRIRRVDAVSGNITAFAGTGAAAFSGDGGAASAATFSQPTAVIQDPLGNILIADAGNLRIRSVSGVPLPLTLLSFTGTLQNSDVTLKWNTSNEVNTQTFIVERGQGQKPFAAIGSVGANSTAGKNSYSYVDKGLAPGTYLYRLKMVDRDGHFTYSPVVSIQSTAAMTGRIVLYPNPVKDVLYVQLQAEGQETMILQLSDMQGRVLQQQEVQLSRGVTGLSFNTSSLAAGSYLILSAGEHKVTAQFIKK